jgi:predicted lipoprotein with Yx(FWY)xxD motif
MTRKLIATAASIGVVALIVAGCGSGSGSSSSSTPAAAASTSMPSLSATTTSAGKIVVDGKGRALYEFTKDTGPKSMCAGACASFWPAYTATTKPAGIGGVSAGSITLVKRADGTKQVALNGHPLYYFKGDQAAGQLNGQGLNDFGAKWWLVAPSGSSVTAAAKASSSSSSSGGSGGGGYAY